MDCHSEKITCIYQEDKKRFLRKYIDWTLPIATISEANCREHWRIKSKRHKAQKFEIWIAFNNKKPKILFPCHVRLTRISPRELDYHDNLRMSLKWVVDAVAEELTKEEYPKKKLGWHDSNKNISWEYAQMKGESKQKAVKIEVFYDIP